MEPGALDELRTERLVLRRPTRDDRADFLRMDTDPEVMATLGGVISESDSDSRLGRSIAHWDAHDFGYWTARDPESENFAGRAGLRHLVVEGAPVVEVGYGFMTDYWGRGIATEAAAAIARAAFETVGLRALVCFTTPTNKGSRNVMEKVGFRHRGDFVHAGLVHNLCELDVDRWQREAARRID